MARGKGMHRALGAPQGWEGRQGPRVSTSEGLLEYVGEMHGQGTGAQSEDKRLLCRRKSAGAHGGCSQCHPTPQPAQLLCAFEE